MKHRTTQDQPDGSRALKTPLPREYKVWSGHKYGKSFYKKFQTKKILDATAKASIPDDVARVLKSLDSMSQKDGILTLGEHIDTRLILLILCHPNAINIRDIRLSNWTPECPQRFDAELEAGVRSFEETFETDFPIELLRLYHFYRIANAALECWLLGGKAVSCGYEQSYFYLGGYEEISGVFGAALTKSEMRSEDVVSARQGHIAINYFPTFWYGSDGLTDGLIFDSEHNAFTFCAHDGDGELSFSGAGSVIENFMYRAGSRAEDIGCVDDVFQIFDGADLDEYEDFLEPLRAWFVSKLACGYFNQFEVKRIKPDRRSKIRYTFDPSFDELEFLSSNETCYIAPTYPVMVLNLSSEFHAVFDKRLLDRIFSLFEIGHSLDSGVQNFLQSPLDSVKRFIELLGVDSPIAAGQDDGGSESPTDAFMSALIQFATNEVALGRPGLALVLGQLLWGMCNEQQTAQSVRLLNSLPDLVCHPILKTVANEHAKTRFEKHMRF